MPFIIDASIAACWLMPDEGNSQANAAYERLVSDYALVPSLWWFEVRNIFIVNERRGRIDRDKTARALSLLADLPIRHDPSPDSDMLCQLARKHRLTAYDAAYLELAVREAAPLATLDGVLARAAQAEGLLMGT